MRRSTAPMAAAAAALLLLLVTAYMLIVSYGERKKEEETRRMFVEWKARHKKTYNSIGEEEHRYAVFKEKLRRIVQRYGPVDHLNQFGDQTPEELNSGGPCVIIDPVLDKAERQVPGRRQRGPAALRPPEERNGGRGEAVTSY